MRISSLTPFFKAAPGSKRHPRIARDLLKDSADNFPLACEMDGRDARGVTIELGDDECYD